MTTESTSAAGCGDNDRVIGKVASPPRHEATSEEFCFWACPDVLVEKTQIVTTSATIGGEPVRFYGVVKEVYRQSRQNQISEEFDRHDGDVAYVPPYEAVGVTYAVVGILRTDPPVLAPPLEGCNVTLGGPDEARAAYAADEMDEPLDLGLIRNGGRRLAGRGPIDAAYLLGANGGGLNVTGVAGRGTKSSFLLHVNYLLLREARRQVTERPGDPGRLRVVPIVLNVKNYDLFHIDRRNRNYDPAKHGAEWRELGVDDPRPFAGVRFFAPQLPGLTTPRDTGRPTADVLPYSWSLSDLIAGGLMSFLFADDDTRNQNFTAFALDLENWLTREETRGTDRQLRLWDGDGRPTTFAALLDLLPTWVANGSAPFGGAAHLTTTIRMFHRRLIKLVYEGNGVLRKDDHAGRPLDVVSADTRDPTVVDLSSLAAVPALQRFVVAAIFQQLVANRTGSRAVRGLVYLVTLDELNRFAPRSGHDPITQLVERVAAEMRSQGIVLLGGQQQASLVSPRVIENAGVKALGKCGTVELNETIWRGLGEAAKRKAATLAKDEKLLVQDGFREPMLVKVPFPAWALRGEEAANGPPAAGGGGTIPLDDL
jgi:hypothetical protein